MATPVVTVASGGLPVVDVTATFPKMGLPVTEALNGRGMAVTKVVGKPGMPVTYSTVADYPAGGGGAFTPADLTGLFSWVDASVPGNFSLSGSSIVSVLDRSPRAYTFTAPLGTKPLYNATGLNGRPTMVFSNAINSGLVQNNLALGGNTLTLFFVGSFNSVGSVNSARALSFTATGGGTFDYNGVGSFMISQDGGNPTTGISFARNSLWAYGSGFGPADTPHICIATINSSGVMTVYIDGVATVGATSPGTFGATGDFWIGNLAVNLNSEWHGVISDAGGASGFTNATDCGRLYTGLKAKWGL